MQFMIEKVRFKAFDCFDYWKAFEQYVYNKDQT